MRSQNENDSSYQNTYIAFPANIYGIAESRLRKPIPVAARTKAWFCGRSPAGIAGSKAALGIEVCV
jgi:hypothetical protein